jgi:hypothetical protein
MLVWEMAQGRQWQGQPRERQQMQVLQRQTLFRL